MLHDHTADTAAASSSVSAIGKADIVTSTLSAPVPEGMASRSATPALPLPTHRQAPPLVVPALARPLVSTAS